MRRTIAPAAALLLLAAVAAPKGRAAGSMPVEIRGFRFEPATLNARPGDTAVWVNHDLVPHTVTSRDGSWESGPIGAGATWRRVLHEGDSTGYVCEYHPTMTGTIVARPGGGR